MNVLTDEQKNYIKEHPDESPYAMSRNFGCAVQTVYWWLHKLHGDSFKDARERRRNEIHEYVRNMYPEMSSSEISKVLGITKSCVTNIAKSLGVTHTRETEERLRRKCAQAIVRPEVIAKRSESLKKTLRLDRYRAANGIRQKTRRKFKTIPSRCLCARNYLCNKYNYFYDKDYGELLTIFYDSETKMLTADQQKHYETKYGIKFLQGAEE